MEFKNILFVGAGGTGSILAPILLRYVLYRQEHRPFVRLIDGDVFEPANMTRQPCGVSDEGINKAMVLRLLLLQQGLTADDVIADYLGPRNANELLTPGTLAVLAVDNAATRKLSAERMEELLGESQEDVLWLSPANSSGVDPAHITGNVMWWGRLDGQLVGMDPRQQCPGIARPTERIPRKGSCASHAPSEPQLLAANALAAAHALNVLGLLLNGDIPPHISSLNFSQENIIYS